MIGIIGGSGVYELSDMADSVEDQIVKTEFGDVKVSILSIKDKKVAFLPRHSAGHSVPPHKINYKANIQALKNIGVKQIIATNAVGSLNPEFEVGDFVLANDFLDFTSLREKTFYDDEVVHIDVTIPFCPRLREFISNLTNIPNGAVLVCTDGPRFETYAEIKMFQKLGGDLMGMTSIPEAVLAREIEMCYATICIVSNKAAGLSEEKLTFEEVAEIMKIKGNELVEILYNIISNLDDDFDCECLHALGD